MKKAGRNDPCPCGSGKKYKQCCGSPGGVRTGVAPPVSHLPSNSLPFNSFQAALAHHQAGRLPQAEAICRQLLQREPHHHEALHLLGLIAHQAGKSGIAVELIGKAVGISPSSQMYCNLGVILYEQGRFSEAEASYRRALELNQGFAEVHCGLGNTLKSLGRFDEAVASFNQALVVEPDFVEVHYNLGNTLKCLGRLDEAMANYKQALVIKPDFVEVHYNLGNTLKYLGRLDEAVISYNQVLAIRPDFADVHVNLGSALKELGRLGEAEASYRQALTIKPDLVEACSNMLYLHAFTRNISPELECSLAANWEVIALNESERAAARQRALMFDDLLERPSGLGRKLRVGVVSAEIGQHAVVEFLEPFLEQVDRSRFHVTLFPTITKHGPRAVRLRQLADIFKPLAGISDSQAADLIRHERIDILIDTTGHMSGCRLGIFARRAAPVQCHYIGYHGTTGLTEMDWFIADETLLPAACDTHFREGIWRLPRLWISYRGDASLPLGNWAPSSDGSVWLGSFNNLTKVREETLALWAKVMHAIPESRLLLKDIQSASHGVRERVRTELCRHGIDNERVEFAGHVPDWGLHMALYDRLDIALDTIPLNSGTTAFDALWMGVPLVALEGDWMGGGMSGTILKALGKPEWVAQNENEYAAITAALAKDVEGRKSLRAAQRELMANSPLCDAKGLTRALEDAFEQMFDRWIEKRECARKECNEKNRP